MTILYNLWSVSNKLDLTSWKSGGLHRQEGTWITRQSNTSAVDEHLEEPRRENRFVDNV